MGGNGSIEAIGSAILLGVGARNRPRRASDDRQLIAPKRMLDHRVRLVEFWLVTDGLDGFALAAARPRHLVLEFPIAGCRARFQNETFGRVSIETTDRFDCGGPPNHGTGLDGGCSS